MYVYFYYNASNEIIYIGQTKAPALRLEQHLSNDTWAIEIKKIDVRGPYSSSDDVSYLEKYYVRLHQPKYNINLQQIHESFVEVSDTCTMITFNSINEMLEYYNKCQDQLDRKTYYLRYDHVEMLEIFCFKHQIDKSELVRRMFDEFFKREPDYENLLIEAMQRLSKKPRKKSKRLG